MTIPAGIIKTVNDDGTATYHNGTLFDGAKPKHIGPYTDSGVTVQMHWWNSQWTYRPNTIVVKRTPAQIIAANQMFPFGDTGCKLNAVPNDTFAGPMDSSGVTKYMPQTGERPDIGLITDASAQFMLGGSPGPMLAWAQANDSFPLHFRDETTGRPIDLLKYPQTNAYDFPNMQGSPWLPKGEPDPNAPQYTKFGGGLEPQQAHFPEWSYIAHMATGDYGFLKNLQYNANFGVLADASKSTPAGAVVSGEVRGIAWTLRNLFMAHIATLEAEKLGALPPSLHPSSYFKKLLDQSLAYYDKLRLDPAQQTFRLIGEFGRFSPWTVDYLLTALAFGVLTGHSEWTPLYLWCFGNVVARTNSTSGYPPGLGTTYRVSTQPGWTWKNAFDAMVGDPEIPLTQAQHDALVTNPLKGGKALMGPEYILTTRAAIVMALYLEAKGLLPGLRAQYPEIDTCFANIDTMVRAGGVMNPRVSVVLDASQAPETVPPLPPPTPKPPTQGNITMSTPVLNGPFTATVHFLDDAEVERPVDSVDWSVTGGAQLDPAHQGNTATGVYAGTGAFGITATGHTAGGPDVVVSVGGTVPVPFPTHGRIDLS